MEEKKSNTLSIVPFNFGIRCNFLFVCLFVIVSYLKYSSLEITDPIRGPKSIQLTRKHKDKQTSASNILSTLNPFYTKLVADIHNKHEYNPLVDQHAHIWEVPYRGKLRVSFQQIRYPPRL